MPNPCYSYPADVPPDSTNRDAGNEALRGLRRMPYPCFSYLGDASPDAGDRAAGSPALPGLREMPSSICFRY